MRSTKDHRRTTKKDFYAEVFFLVYSNNLTVKYLTAKYLSISAGVVIIFLSLAAVSNAQQISLSAVIDQASDGDFCNSIYNCNLSPTDLSALTAQDSQSYQIKDHTNIFSNGAWPQIYFAPDRYLQFNFIGPHLSPEDVILGSDLVISHQINQAKGIASINHDIKLEISGDGGSSWEIFPSDIWPETPNNYSVFQVPIPANYLDTDSLNNLSVRLLVFGDDGSASLSSILDMVRLDIDYYNSKTNNPPVNIINTPSKDQQLAGEITFKISATDDFGITEYKLSLLDDDNNLITTCLQATIASSTALMVSCQLDTADYLSGPYKLQVETKDNAGIWTTTTQPVTFDNVPPVTNISSFLPQSDTFWKEPITISGTSQDNIITSFVDLYFKETEVASPWSDLVSLANSTTDSLFSWSYEWDPSTNSGPGEGSYHLSASASDAAGNQETTQLLAQNIIYDNTGPQLQWEYPDTDKSTVSGTANLKLTGTDNLSGIESVTFSYEPITGGGHTNIATVQSEPYSTSWDTSSIALGDYQIKGQAVDKAGNISEIFRSISVSPIIDNIVSHTPAFGKISVGWTTQRPTSGQVVYGTVSQPVPNPNDLNYGYAFSSNHTGLPTKIVSHNITLAGLSNNTIYYYRIVSTGSPSSLSHELTNKTLSLASPEEKPVPVSMPAPIQITTPSTLLPSPARPLTTPSALSINQDISPSPPPNIPSETAVLGATTDKPQTWMLVASLIISALYLTYLFKRRLR